MKYAIEFTDPASKNFLKLPKSEARKISKKIDALSTNPTPNGYKKIQGEENLFRIRSGDYRILYQIFENRVVILVVRIGHRKDVYRSIGS